MKEEKDKFQRQVKETLKKLLEPGSNAYMNKLLK